MALTKGEYDKVYNANGTNRYNRQQDYTSWLDYFGRRKLVE